MSSGGSADPEWGEGPLGASGPGGPSEDHALQTKVLGHDQGTGASPGAELVPEGGLSDDRRPCCGDDQERKQRAKQE